MQVFENSGKKVSEVHLIDFPFVCRICLRRGALKLFEGEGCLLDVFMIITKIDVRSSVDFPKNICNECVNKLKDIIMFIDMSKCNAARSGKNLILNEVNVYEAVDDCRTSQKPVENTKKTPEESEICRMCFSSNCLTLFEKNIHLMQLFQNITNIDVEDKPNSLTSGNRACHKCINKLESISTFISLALCNNIKFENILKTENDVEDNSFDVGSSKDETILRRIPDRVVIKTENCPDESVCSYENNDSYEFVQIKEEILESSECPTQQNYQNGLDFCLKTDSVEKLLECDPSENEFKGNQETIISERLDDNLEDQIESKHFKCYFCGKIFKLEKRLEQHLVSHTQENNFSCNSCEKSFSRKSSLRRHVLIHSGKNLFQCDLCQKNFTSNEYLKTHLLGHTGEKPFKCNCCSKSFTRKCVLNDHLLTHTGERPFKCDYCPKCFSHHSNLRRHLRTHIAGKLFKCACCDESFAQKEALKVHSVTHVGEKPFKCDCCEKSFARKCHLNTHLLLHTGQKPFKCDYCEKSFAQKGTLKEHTRTHTGEKPFKCDQCSKSFATKCVLKGHLLTHTGEKPFKCDWCERSFSHRNNLRWHLVSHTGAKLFKCEFCEKDFARKRSLQRHLLTHTE